MQVVKINKQFWVILSSGMGSNKYVIKSRDLNILIDPGLPSDVSQLCTVLLKEVQLDPDDINAILLTHTHPDHSGAVPYFRERSGAEVLVHHAEVPIFEESYHQNIQSLFMRDERSYSVKKSLNDGDILLEQDNGRNWRVLHTPGHSKGSICLYNEMDGLLITGDTVFAGGSVGRTDLGDGDSNALLESIARLCELEIKGFFPGHMDIVLENARENIYRSLRTAQWFLDRNSGLGFN
ncbi:MAG: MBL fold metallo-hydrolase [Candidatus Odinarchaeota archaeon]